MFKTKINQFICVKEFINEEEYNEISQLEKICNREDKVNLKLELDYKLNMYKEFTDYKIGINEVNEFLYYANETLIAYLGISSFGGNIGEINGMTHPKWRRKGVFRKLLKLAVDECKIRKFNKILLLADGKSKSGEEFIKAMGGKYDFSENRMKRIDKEALEENNLVNLRKAEESDKEEIVKENAIFFNDEGEVENSQNLDNRSNSFYGKIQINDVYMAELNGNTIGKINIEYNEDSAFIYGFGILPEFRGKGYGKAILKEALKFIGKENINEVQLDVEYKNERALNLYKTCGFQEISVMNYYEYK